jgi:hypothetical protein
MKRSGVNMNPIKKTVLCIEVFEVVANNLFSICQIIDESKTERYTFGCSKFANFKCHGYE